MAKLQTGSNTNYQGKLYTKWTETSSDERSNYGVGTTSYREPTLVTNNKADTSAILTTITGTGSDAALSLYQAKGAFHGYFTDVKEFGQTMQNDFNKMVESVDKYKGFYVGRYETSISGETVASTTGIEDTRPMAKRSWYNMYKLQREYSNANRLTSVQSSMIWGSQYDAMLNWVIVTKTDAAKVIASNNAPHDNSTNGTYRPGSQESDKINNIYDLEGNVREWTLTGRDNFSRTLRGGSYKIANNPSWSSYATDAPVSTQYDDYGTRFVLYMNF